MRASPSEHFVVAIGASAGGLEAFSDFFDNAPENEQLTYILIQHLSPAHKSLLVELLSKHTKMKIVEAVHDQVIEGNCVYVIPPAKNMTVNEGKLQLTDKDPADKGPHTSIDTFFYSLANEYEERAIAVVLSGTGTDGSRGIHAVKENGGLVIVQEPESAKFDGMPRSSIGTGLADLVLPAKRIHAEILNYITNTPVKLNGKEKISEELLSEIFEIVHSNTGCNFTDYKLPTVIRRLTRRLTFLKLNSPKEYLLHLQERPEESRIFCRDLLIGVTKFFRDKEAFETLKEKVLIPLVDSKAEHEVIKVWVTACSTGEEVYSIAMLLDDIISKKKRNLQLKIFATDLEASHIERAARGEYGRFVRREIPPDLFEKYFVQKENSLVVSPALRKMVVFARHNLATDPPFIKNDLISCRNMLIYMNNQLQNKIVSKFAFGLNAGGHLFLGSSESLSQGQTEFEETDRKWKIFRRTRMNSSKYNYSNLNQKTGVRFFKKEKSNSKGIGLLSAGKEVVFEDFDLASFYIDRNYIIHDTAGQYKKYLELPEQGLHFNLLKMLPDSVSIPLNTMLIKVWKYNEANLIQNLQATIHGVRRNLSISVRPPDENREHTLVVFNSIEIPIPVAEPATNGKGSTAEVKRLKRELEESRFNLQTAVEELETTNEELQSSNEELLSGNEELQSSNEELQSLNEELHTLNAEHQQKIHELTELNDDLNNYFRCSDIGQIFLDKRLKIRKFNPAVMRMINILDHDIGRPVTDLTMKFDSPDFERDLKEVLTENKVIEREFNLEGLTVLMRIYSYVTRQKKIEGVVLSFIDITRSRQLSSILHSVFEASQQAIFALSSIRNKQGQIVDLEVVSNNRFAETFADAKNEHNRTSFKEHYGEISSVLFHEIVPVINSNEIVNQDLKFGERWYHASAVQMLDGAALILSDITARKNAEDKLRQSYSELYATKERLKKLNQNLEDTVMERTRALSASEERFRLVSAVTNDAIIDWNFVDNSLWVSENFERLFGYNRQDTNFTRNFWLSKIHPSDRQRVINSLNEKINLGKNRWKEEYRYANANGEYHIVQDRGHLVKDENGTPYRMVSSMLDITELRAAERELAESELRLNYALDAAEMAGFELNLKEDKLRYSKKLPEIFGRPYAENFTSAQLRSQFHPDDKQSVNLIFDNALKGEPYIYEARIVWPNGSIHWVRTMGNVMMDDQGKPDKLIGITRETTREKNYALDLEEKVNERTAEMREALERLRLQNQFIETVFNEVVQSFIVLDNNLTVKSINKAAENLFQLSKEDAEGKPYEEFFGKRVPEIEEAAKGKFSQNLTEYLSGNKLKKLENFYVPLVHNEEQYGVLVIAHDNTQMIEASEQLRVSNSQLTKSNSDLEQFAYIASHDLQEPLRKIQTFVSMLQKQQLNRQTPDYYLDKIAGSAARMAGLIKNVLQFSRLSHFERVFMPVDLNKIMAQLKVDFELLIREKKAIVNISPMPEISGISHQLGQLFYNLLSNALKFSDNECVVNITSRDLTRDEIIANALLEPGRAYVEVKVEDNGIGFDPQQAKKIFGFFYRLEGQANYSGNGIGLALCKKIAENHFGTITAESTPGKGSTFRVVLAK